VNTEILPRAAHLRRCRTREMSERPRIMASATYSACSVRTRFRLPLRATRYAAPPVRKYRLSFSINRAAIQPLPSGQVSGPFFSGSREAKYCTPGRGGVLLWVEAEHALVPFAIAEHAQFFKQFARVHLSGARERNAPPREISKPHFLPSVRCLRLAAPFRAARNRGSRACPGAMPHLSRPCLRR
jgi:hypothetical protein